MGILIVDDSPDTRLLLRRVLETAGHADVQAVGSAREAFARLGMDGHPPSGQIDLVLMDIVMPGMSGVEACSRIKANPELRDIPIMMVTAQPEGSELQSAFEAGAQDYIRKPLDRIVLLARVGAALRLKREIDERKARERDLLEAQEQLKEANRRLEQLATVDALVGIANRRRLDEHLQEEWRRSQRSHEPLALILLDIDHFKKYNDTFGHPAGDDCLKRIATTLSSELGRPGDLLARYGGEEMAAVLQGTTREGAVQVAEQLRRVVEELHIPHSGASDRPFVTISLGVASVVPTSELTCADLVHAADQALYAAKHAGRDCVRSGEVVRLG